MFFFCFFLEKLKFWGLGRGIDIRNNSPFEKLKQSVATIAADCSNCEWHEGSGFCEDEEVKCFKLDANFSLGAGIHELITTTGTQGAVKGKAGFSQDVSKVFRRKFFDSKLSLRDYSQT